MISFLMMAKNVAPYVSDAVDSLQKVDSHAWELIIVDDGSTDATYSIASDYALKDVRIKVFRNPFTGKVQGTSFAYTKAAGSIIKCIDSDDVLLPEFFDFLLMHEKHDVLFHSAKIVNSDFTKTLRQIAYSRVADLCHEERIKGQTDSVGKYGQLALMRVPRGWRTTWRVVRAVRQNGRSDQYTKNAFMINDLYGCKVYLISTLARFVLKILK